MKEAERRERTQGRQIRRARRDCALQQRGRTMKRGNFGPRLALAVLFGAALSLAGQTTTGKIHGTVTDPAGSQITAGTISLYEGAMTSATVEAKYTFQVSGSGEYKGEVAPGTYTLVFRSPTT